MKKMIAALVAIALSIFLTVECYADNATGADCREFVNFFDGDEFASVVEDISGDEFSENVELLSAYDIHKNSDVKAYKLYKANSSDFIQKISEGSDVHTLISDAYSWIIPNQNTATKVVLRENGEWDAIGYATFVSEYNDTVWCDDVNLAVNELLAEVNDEVKDIVCVNVPIYFTNFVCVTLYDSSYLIPFSSRPDFTGLTNGHLYSPDEVSGILLQTMGERGNALDGNIGGAGFMSNNSVNTIPAPVIIVPAVAIAVGIAAILIYYRNKRNKIK